MATQSKSVSGINTIYTITDIRGNVATITAVQQPGYEFQVSYAGGPVLQDANAMISTLMQLLSTGLTP